MDKYLKRKKIFVAPKAPPVVESPPPPPTEEMSTPTSKKLKQEELEVTGVSRSGRVRKKSSKLTDFESPDEIDPRYKRKADRLAAAEASMSEASPVVAAPTSTPKPKKSTAGKKAAAPPPPPLPVEDSPPRDMGGSDEEEVEEEEESYSHGMKAVPDFDSDPETSLMYGHTEEVGDEEEPSSGEESADDGTANSDEEIDDDLDDDDDEGQLVMVDDPKPSRPTNQSMSLYMLEKSSKKRLVVIDGKIIGRKKAQRKDKGKSRFTAYMLWAKEARKEIVRSNPDMDFSTTSKRLGELWSIVPNSEKYSWRRRAKRMSVKQKADECKAAAAAAVGHTPASTGRKFINKASPPAAVAKMTSPPRSSGNSDSESSSSEESDSSQDLTSGPLQKLWKERETEILHNGTSKQ